MTTDDWLTANAVGTWPRRQRQIPPRLRSGRCRAWQSPQTIWPGCGGLGPTEPGVEVLLQPGWVDLDLPQRNTGDWCRRLGVVGVRAHRNVVTGVNVVSGGYFVVLTPGRLLIL